MAEIIESNKIKYPDKIFLISDIIYDPLPAADLVICRDCFIHLRNSDVNRVLQNFKLRGIKYLLSTTYPVNFNTQILTGHFRPINLQKPPFNLPEPFELIPDFAKDGTEKYLGFWKLNEDGP